MKTYLFSNLTRRVLLVVAGFSYAFATQAQGAKGIDAGASELATYIDPVANLILTIGAIVGLVGGVRCYIKWNSGDNDVQKSVMGWMGSCVFLLCVGVIVKAMFGV
ncbi:DUF4134 domain-containing protein (plasmid) [Adhaeribacter swui]|uniref:DUF4134 domain-containing protein n=1 Tax=Adhaeribacter swui TaxID=2086471 RepID=A0A7G7G2G3_9BACT|nr:DUF4134 domain-containing protein [Adhaeribacter swui]QNF31347.1 DUF4134 domain-containing protein [Adhaeribacter swui]